MLLIKFDPFKQIKEIEKNLYNQSKNEGVSAFVPVVNTREGEFAYHVDVDLPGVKKEDIKVDINKGTGFWGPPMRLGASSEISVLKLSS